MQEMTIQDAGRKLLARMLTGLTVHVAIGRGDGAWQTPPANPTTGTALINEIARRQATIVGYVEPSTKEEATVELPGELYYKASVAPTKYLHISTTFGFGEAADEDVREIALFFNTVAAAGVAAGKRYLLPAEVANGGDCWGVLYQKPDPRPGTKQATENFVFPL